MMVSHLTADREKLEVAISAPIFATGTTNMADALNISLNEFIECGRQGYNKIIVLISDGEPDDEQDVLVLASQLKAFQVTIAGVLVGGQRASTEYMRQISTEGLYVESDYQNLIKELKKLAICL